MSEQSVKNWLQQFIASTRPVAKRKPGSLNRWTELIESLEERQVLSAVIGSEELPVPAEVAAPLCDNSAKPAKVDRHQNHGKAAPEFPVVTGVWDLTVSATLNNNTQETTGTVEISQKKGKISGNVQLDGLPLFTIKGSLEKMSMHDLKGSTKYPIEISDGNFHSFKATLTIHFSQDLQSFTGTAHRTVFGQTFNATLTGIKEA
jgi:hypothetical protein